MCDPFSAPPGFEPLEHPCLLSEAEILTAIVNEVYQPKRPDEVTLAQVRERVPQLSERTVGRRLAELERQGKLSSRLALHDGAEQRVYRWLGSPVRRSLGLMERLQMRLAELEAMPDPVPVTLAQLEALRAACA